MVLVLGRRRFCGTLGSFFGGRPAAARGRFAYSSLHESYDHEHQTHCTVYFASEGALFCLVFGEVYGLSLAHCIT